MAEITEVLTRIEGRAGRITLDRPKALNALNLAMVQAIMAALTAWKSDPAVALVAIDAVGERAFCAGGDIRALWESGRRHDGEAEAFWRAEYEMNSAIARYPKPVVTLMHDIVMGGGVGLGSHARYRIMDETVGVAMPEVGIGFIPDVGGTWLLSRAPRRAGYYAALTGERLSAADGLYLGLADYLVPAAARPDLLAALTAPDLAAEGIEASILRFATTPTASELVPLADPFERVFAAGSMVEVLSRLDTEAGAWPAKTAATIRTKSPTSLSLTLRALNEATRLPNLDACLKLEYRIACACMRGHDFYEGVRAAVVDKDRNPKWDPARVEDVTPDLIEPYFAPRPGDELEL